MASLLPEMKRSASFSLTGPIEGSSLSSGGESVYAADAQVLDPQPIARNASLSSIAPDERMFPQEPVDAERDFIRDHMKSSNFARLEHEPSHRDDGLAVSFISTVYKKCAKDPRAWWKQERAFNRVYSRSNGIQRRPVLKKLAPPPSSGARRTLKKTYYKVILSCNPNSSGLEHIAPPAIASPVPCLCRLKLSEPVINTSVNFEYIIVLSHSPLYECKSWEPKSDFFQGTLDALVNELPLDNKASITGFFIRMIGLGAKITRRVKLGPGQESSSRLTKIRILETLDECEQNGCNAEINGPVVVEIEIDPIWEDGVTEGDVDDDDSFYEA